MKRTTKKATTGRTTKLFSDAGIVRRTGRTLGGNLDSSGKVPAGIEGMGAMIADSRYDRDPINLEAADREELRKMAEAKKIAAELASKNAEPAPYRLSIYIKGMPGSFQYHVGTRDQAIEHFAAITERGYRRVNDRGQLVWYAPAQIESIKIAGDGLDTNNPDRFVRT